MMLWVCKVIYHRWCQNEEQCSTSATHATAPWVLLFGSHHKFYVSGRCSSLMVIVLDSRLRSAGLSAGHVNVLCSWVKHFTLTVANFWGSLKKCWGETLSWTSNRSQMMSNVNTKEAHEAQTSVSLMFIPHFDVICDKFLWRRAATWNPFVIHDKRAKCCSWWHNICVCPPTDH